ncbi:MAG TPA: Arm DNA-binding domain-containing protein [Nevskiaceae bacterium]|nr:Arm DNA-binding domain-containing protein [Nevskiaceae bacterium]
MLRKAKPGAKPYKLSRELGLFLLVNPNGTRLWRFSYTFEGWEKLLALGVYPDVPLQMARDRRDEARRLLAAGTDPSADRQAILARRALEAANTFQVVAGEWLAMKSDSLSAGTHNKAR